VRVEFERELEVPRVKGDREQLRQVFQNLISNSVQAMPAGGTLHVRRDLHADAESTALQVRIRDGGGGIPEQVRSRLFEPFVTSRAEGTGLGLAIASSIVSRHGGRLSLDSTGETGTTFLVTLPVVTD
jgi:two-component system, NtrC family, sensor histidine kinase HydH